MDFVLGGNTARAAGDDQAIARLQGVLRDAILPEAIRVGPFCGIPANNLLLVSCIEVNPGMRACVLERDEVPFDGDGSILEVVSGEGVMRRSGPDYGQENSQKY